MSIRINVNPILKNENTTPISFEYKADNLSEIQEDLPIDELKMLNVSGEVKIHDMVLKIFFDLVCDYTTRCARCDCPINSSIKMSDEKIITLSSDEDNGYETDSFVAEEGILILEDFIVEFLSLALPYKELCRKDCKGLCSVCGEDLNENECNCTKRKINPNFKVLDDFFEDKNQ